MNVGVSVMQNAAFNKKTVPEAGIRIYEICDSTETNPKPNSDHEISLGEFVSPQKLKELSGCSNLFDVMELKLKVDTNETSIGNIGSMVPNLKRLNLNNSYITSVRDLGTSFSNLTMAWLCRCSLSELDGISSLTSLKELYLAFNEISDLSPLSMLDTLEVVDLESNNVDDIMQVEFLSLCNNLTNLTMKGNPVEMAPTSDTKESDLKFYSYQDAILSRLPSLNVLDDEFLLVEKVDGVEVKRVNPTKTKAKTYTNDLRIIADSLKSFDIEEDENTVENQETSRPRTAHRRLRSSHSPQSKQTTQANEHANWKMNAKNESNNHSPFETSDSSDLTTGGIMCGNPVSALRQRKRQQAPAPPRSTTTDIAEVTAKVNKTRSLTSFKPEHSYLTSEDIDTSESKEDIFEELKKWRLNNQALFDESNNKTLSTQQQEGFSEVSQTFYSPNSSRDVSRPSFSPAPPSMPRRNKTPSRTRRSFPSPPVSPCSEESERPHTVAEFRSTDVSVDLSTDGQSSDVRNSLIKEDEETDFAINPRLTENQTPVRRSDSFTNRPSTARAALQSLQRPFTRTR